MLSQGLATATAPPAIRDISIASIVRLMKPFDASPYSAAITCHLALVESLVCSHRGKAAVEVEHRARRYYISGAVQGVGYRYFAQRTAERLGLAGYAKNLRDGRVEVYAVGPAAMLDEFRTVLNRGPSGSLVSGVADEVAPLDAEHSHGFIIEHGKW